MVNCRECRFAAGPIAGIPYCNLLKEATSGISGCAAGKKKPVSRGDLVRCMDDTALATFMTLVAVRGGEACAGVLGLDFETDEESRQNLTAAHLRWLREKIEED